jgi:cell shape-determining protein MreC
LEGLYVLIFVFIFIIGFIISLIFIVKKLNKMPVGYKVKMVKDNPIKEIMKENKNKDELVEEVKKLRQLAEKTDKENEEKKKIEGWTALIYLALLAVLIYFLIRYINWNAIINFLK